MYVNKKLDHKKNISEIKKSSDELGSQAPTSSEDFSIAESPFETQENTKLSIARFLETSPSWSLTVAFNMMQKPTLDEDELRQLFDSSQNIPEADVLTAFKKNKTKGTYLLAQYITKKYDIITIGEKEREIFIYQEGIYFQAENEIIFPEIQRILGEEVNKSAKLETLHKIHDMTAKPRSIFESAQLNFIPLLNGVYDIYTKELLPHSPDYKFKYKFPITYLKDSLCPKTLSFIEQVLSPEQVATFQEWLGYYFYRLYIFKKAIIFVGEGDTGKTTLLEVITYLLGRDNLSSISLQKMSSDKFSAAHLYEKHGNLVDELSARDISDTGSFKVATGGGTVTGEYKFGNQFGFHNFSKFTFACNKIPDVTDMDDIAYFNRWMVIRFEKVIEKKIPNFVATLQTDDERSGLFNWAMEGLERLIANGRFSYSSDAMDTKKEMMRSGSSVAVFCAENLKQETGTEISKEDMYEAYTRFCEKNELSTETIKMFGTKLPFYVSYINDGLITIQGKSGKAERVRGWRNVSVIKTEDEQKVEDKTTKEFNDF